MHRAVERIGRRHRADQDQHDQPHALLTVIRAMEEADAGAGQDQQAADPEGGGSWPSGALYSGGMRTSDFTAEQRPANKKPKIGETSSEWPISGLAPIDAAGAVTPAHELVHQAHADHRTDQRVELDDGRPSHQVPRFQMIAAISRAKTIANPALLPT